MTSSQEDIEPLEPELWFGALQRLAARQRASDGQDLENMLRHGFHLAQLTPGPLKGFVRCAASEAAFEALLAAGALESAALTLIGAPLALQLSRSPALGDRCVEARVSFPAGEQPATRATCRTVGGALLGAWAACLVELRQRSLEVTVRPLRQGLRIEPSAPRRRSSEH